jgi:hypothetical protein
MSEQSQRALLLDSIVSRFEERVNEFLDYAQAHPQSSLYELETHARRLSRECFAPALEAVVLAQQVSAQAYVMCECGKRPHYKGAQMRSQETYAGRIQWSRGYYYCAECKKGSYPLDEALGIGPGAFSEGLRSGVSRLGSALPFRAASETFEALCGVSISAREVARITEGQGMALEAKLAQERQRLMNEQPKASANPDGPGIWSVALDAAKVRFVDGWHEAKAGVVFWAEPEGAHAQEQSYLVEVGPMEEAGARLYAEALRRGIDPSENLVVCLGDGALGNWNQFSLHFPRRVEVLDWYHAIEHLWAAANGVFGEGKAEAKAWVEQRKAQLWEGKVEAVLDALHWQAQQPYGKAAQAEIHYFETNKARMRYHQYRSKGYPIGSGTVESACKRVIAARVKQAGMRWSHEGAQAVLSLRAELLSGRWEQAWRDTRSFAMAA